MQCESSTTYSTVTHHMFLPRYRRKIEAPTVADTRLLKKPVWVIVCVLSLSVYLHSCLLSPNASSYWWSLAVWLSNIRQLSIDCIDPFSATDPYCEGSSLRWDPEAFLSGDATLKLILWSSTESTFVCLQRALFSEGGSAQSMCYSRSVATLACAVVALSAGHKGEQNYNTWIWIWPYCDHKYMKCNESRCLPYGDSHSHNTPLHVVYNTIAWKHTCVALLYIISTIIYGARWWVMPWWLSDGNCSPAWNKLWWDVRNLLKCGVHQLMVPWVSLL